MKSLVVIIAVALGFISHLPAEAKTSNEDAIYDSNPNHLWNRLFAVFYRQEIAFVRTIKWLPKGDTNQFWAPRWIGPDLLDPPLGHHPKFLLEDEPFARCNALLDEFISRHGATLIHDPLKRALLQRDLWAVFDVLAQAGQESVFPVPAYEFKFTSPLPAAQEQHRATLERKLAQVIHSLALSRVQIEKLPDTYRDAIRSGAFSNVPETNRFNFLPRDLFATASGWHEIMPSHSFSFSYEPQVLELLEHTLVAGGRSVFRAFVKLPADSKDTKILANYAAENVRITRENDRCFAEWRQFWSTNKIARSNVLALSRWQFSTNREAWRQFALTNHEAADHLSPKPAESTLSLPWGTQFLLLREMISLDENGQMVPTHVVESVQFRTRSHIDSSGIKRSLNREVELRRALLFQSQQGGLRPIPEGEPRASFYNNLGHLRVDKDGNGPFQRPFPENCGQCHSPYPNSLVSPVAAFSKPSRSVSIEPIARWKEASGKLDLLRRLMLTNSSDR